MLSDIFPYKEKNISFLKKKNFREEISINSTFLLFSNGGYANIYRYSLLNSIHFFLFSNMPKFRRLRKIIIILKFKPSYTFTIGPQWPRVLRRGSAAARKLGLWARIPPGDMDVCLLYVLCAIQVEVSATG